MPPASRHPAAFLVLAAGCAAGLLALAQWMAGGGAPPAVTAGVQAGALIGALTAMAGHLAIRAALHRSNLAFFTVYFSGLSLRLLLVFACGVLATRVDAIDPAALLLSLVGACAVLSVAEPFLLPAGGAGEDA